MSSHPSVSVIIPAYNAAKFIRDGLASLEAQSRRPDEVIVIDDGSTDKTGVLVHEFAKKSELNIHYEWQENSGTAAARNAAIRLSRGEYLAFLDADDIFYPEFLELAVEALSRYPQWVACFSDRDVVDVEGTLLGRDLDHPKFRKIRKRALDRDFVELCDDQLFKMTISGSVIPLGAVYRRSAVEAVSAFDTAMGWTEGLLFLLKLMKHGTLGYIDRPLGTWLRHDSNKSGVRNALPRYASYELITNALVLQQNELNLSNAELAEVFSVRKAHATGWMYVASRQGAAGTVALGFKLFRERRIGLVCFAKAMARYAVAITTRPSRVRVDTQGRARKRGRGA